jgi:hypothetical protein
VTAGFVTSLGPILEAMGGGLVSTTPIKRRGSSAPRITNPAALERLLAEMRRLGTYEVSLNGQPGGSQRKPPRRAG